MLIDCSLKAQYSVEVETWAIDPSKDVWVYAGSLPATSAGNFQKIKNRGFWRAEAKK